MMMKRRTRRGSRDEEEEDVDTHARHILLGAGGGDGPNFRGVGTLLGARVFRSRRTDACS
eukprot:5083568-Pyramimonas_sp.AAC.1